MERMRRRYHITLAVVVLLILAALWYTRPLSFYQLCPGIDPAEPSSMVGIYEARYTHPTGKVSLYFDGTPTLLSPDSPALQELFQILERQTYHRRLTSLLPRWLTDLYIHDNSHITGWMIGASARNDSWHLDLTTYGYKMWMIYRCGSCQLDIFCKVKDQKAFHQEVYDLLVQYKREDL